MYQEIKSKRIENTISEIIDQYAFADKSVGPGSLDLAEKDSTVLLTLVWIALRRIREDLPNPFQLKTCLCRV